MAFFFKCTLSAKLGKNCELYASDRPLFEEKIKEKAQSEPGSAFFDIRSVASLMRLKARPSIGAAAQVAFDIFHLLFRDRILDLQACALIFIATLTYFMGNNSYHFISLPHPAPTGMHLNSQQ